MVSNGYDVRSTMSLFDGQCSKRRIHYYLVAVFGIAARQQHQ